MATSPRDDINSLLDMKEQRCRRLEALIQEKEARLQKLRDMKLKAAEAKEAAIAARKEAAAQKEAIEARLAATPGFMGGGNSASAPATAPAPAAVW